MQRNTTLMTWSQIRPAMTVRRHRPHRQRSALASRARARTDPYHTASQGYNHLDFAVPSKHVICHMSYVISLRMGMGVDMGVGIGGEPW